jgi:hypothetical protein
MLFAISERANSIELMCNRGHRMHEHGGHERGFSENE